MTQVLHHENYRRAAGAASASSVSAGIIEYIDEHYADDISLRDIAKMFGYSPSHLTNTFSRVTGLPITAWIIKRRIIAAQQLLRQQRINVTTASEAVGFNDISYFTRQFSRHVGITPGRFARLPSTVANATDLVLPYPPLRSRAIAESQNSWRRPS